MTRPPKGALAIASATMCLGTWAACASNEPVDKSVGGDPSSGDEDEVARARVLSEADAVRPLAHPAVHGFLDAAATLPEPAPVYIACDDRRTGPCRLAREGDPDADLFGAAYFFNTRYGSPVSYARPLTVLAEADVALGPGAKVLDFGYGYLGHLHMLAMQGAAVHGVEVDPVLPLLYAEHIGAVGDGSITLHHGALFVDDALTEALGDGFDLVMSKNVLKRGYIHPAREAKPEQLIDLGVSDAVFAQGVLELLKPGGHFLIYNLSPKQNPPEQPYIPWADGRCPFDEGVLTEVGFEVRAYDVVDDEAIRALARALGWDADMNVEDLFARYTLLRRPLATQ